jgi:hypothetical protein
MIVLFLKIKSAVLIIPEKSNHMKRKGILCSSAKISVIIAETPKKVEDVAAMYPTPNQIQKIKELKEQRKKKEVDE